MKAEMQKDSKSLVAQVLLTYGRVRRARECGARNVGGCNAGPTPGGGPSPMAASHDGARSDPQAGPARRPGRAVILLRPAPARLPGTVQPGCRGPRSNAARLLAADM